MYSGNTENEEPCVIRLRHRLEQIERVAARSSVACRSCGGRHVRTWAALAKRVADGEKTKVCTCGCCPDWRALAQRSK